MINKKLSTNYLFKIIKSLTTAEKRHVKLQLTQSIDAIAEPYILLFNLTNKQEAYDETLLLKAWQKKFNPKYLPKFKYKLYNKILQSLTTLHKSRNIHFELRGLIDSIEVLYQKQLYVQCHQQVLKVLELAANNQCLTYELEAIQWQQRLHQHFSLPNKQTYQDLQTKGYQLQQAFGLEMQLKEILSELIFLRQTGSPLNDIHHTKVAYWGKVDHLPTTLSRLLLYEIKGVFYQLKKDFGAAFHNFENALETWEPALINLHIDMYTRQLLQLSLCAFASNNQISKPQLLAYTQQSHTSYLATIKWLTLGFNTLSLKTQVADNKHVKITQKLQEHTENNDAFWLNVFQYAIALHYFAQTQYQKAAASLHQVFNNASKHLFLTTSGFAYVLKFICHHELGDIDLLDSLYRKILRLKQQNSFDTSLEHKILPYIKKLYQTMPLKLALVYQEIENALNSCSLQCIEVQLLNHWVSSKKTAITAQPNQS